MIKLAFIPGFINTLKEYEHELLMAPDSLLVFGLQQLGRDNIPRPNQRLDFRSQYDFLENQLKHQTDTYILFGVSMGATFATYLAHNNPDKIKALILGDYLPQYYKIDENWVDSVLNMKELQIKPGIVKRLAEDSEDIEMTEILASINCPVVLLKGERSNLTTKDFPAGGNNEIIVIPKAGHDIFSPDPMAPWDAISKFCKSNLGLP